MKRVTDVNVWIGAFPFRRLARTSLEETADVLGALGVEQALVSSFEAVFSEDSYTAEAGLHDAVAQYQGDMQFHHFKVVNPNCSWWLRDLDRAMEQFCIRGLRLCPTFHDYALDHPRMTTLMQVAEQRRLPVQILCRMQDSRIQWMLHTKEIEPNQIRTFLEHWPDAPLILSGLHVSDMRALADVLAQTPNTLVDCSRLKGPWRTFVKLKTVMSLEHLCFGSLWPINLPHCPFAQLQHAAIPQNDVDAILSRGSAVLTATPTY